MGKVAGRTPVILVVGLRVIDSFPATFADVSTCFCDLPRGTGFGP